MARLMVGRDMAKLYPSRKPDASGEVVLRGRRHPVPGYVEDASFELRRGEILGFGGLVGAGRTELFEGLLALRPSRGTRLARRQARALHRCRARPWQAGVVYLSEDRKGKGLLLEQNLAHEPDPCRRWTASRAGRSSTMARRCRRSTRRSRDFDIRTRSRDLLAGQLSGGNQQKLLLAKMMLLEPRIVIIDEPTRGVDIGTKQQIYSFHRGARREGRGRSSSSPRRCTELIGLCHRVLVMRAGRIAGEVAGDDMTEDAIVYLATGVHEQACGRGRGGRMSEAIPQRRRRACWLGGRTCARCRPSSRWSALIVAGRAAQPGFPQRLQPASTWSRAPPSSPSSRSARPSSSPAAGSTSRSGRWRRFVAGLDDPDAERDAAGPMAARLPLGDAASRWRSARPAAWPTG